MKKKKTNLAALVLLLVFVVGGAIAYFTDTDTATNTFTIGNVEIEVLEPTWDTTGSAKAEDMMPGETAEKDPQIHNKSTTNPAYVFMKVESPCTTDTTPVELLPYTANTTNWNLMTNGTCTNGKVTRIYSYGTSTAMTALAADATTEALFDSVTLESTFTGSSNMPQSTDITITGYAIQSEGLTATAPSAVWSAANFS